MNLKNQSILITGGTGSFGKMMLEKLLTKNFKLKRIVIFSRDELKQEELRKKFPEKTYKNLRYFIGDIRDYHRLIRAFEGIDIVIHAAALKQVPTAEYNPIEYIKTNIIGAQNIIEASIENKVKKIIALSTDKAAAPINLYGATKLCSDKLFVAANNYAARYVSFTVVRYGNVMGSRGSIIPELLNQSKTGCLTLTDQRMTRFNISLEDAVKIVLFAIKNAKGNEIIIPKLPSYKLTDLAKAVGPKCKIKYIGIRPGEKIHEEMITISDSYNTYDLGKYFIILPSDKRKIIRYYKKKFKAKKVKPSFCYSSGQNKDFLSVSEIRKLISNI